MSTNTLLSDINEIKCGFFLNGKKWMDAASQKHFESRIKQVSPENAEESIAKAEYMANEFISWAKKNGYSGKVVKVWWTARPNSMTLAVGYEVDQRKNPSDLLVKFEKGPMHGFLGLSAKATKGKTDIGFKNPGIGTVDKNLSLKIGDSYKALLSNTISKMKLPDSSDARKKYIRENPKVKAKTEAIGVEFLSAARDVLLKRLLRMNQKESLTYILSDWMDAEVITPPYIKVTGFGAKGKYYAAVSDPLNNPKLAALRKGPIKFAKIGNESISVSAGDKKIMKIRFKFESEKMASSLKLSGDPW